jgi:hypothetical protein
MGEYNGPWDMMRTGVTTDEQTRFNAYPMMISSLLYLVVQVRYTDWFVANRTNQRSVRQKNVP